MGETVAHIIAAAGPLALSQGAALYVFRLGSLIGAAVSLPEGAKLIGTASPQGQFESV